MHKNRTSSNNLWTIKHDAYCLTNSLTPSAKLLWQYLVYQGEEQELELDIEDEFNHWVVGKRGKPFDPKTLKTAFKQLGDCAIINVLRKFSWKAYKFFLRPLDWLTPKKKIQNPESIPDLHSSKDWIAEVEVSNNNNNYLSDEDIDEMEKVLDVCEKNGIVFNPVKSPEILDYTLEDVNLAIECFIAAGGHEVNRFGRRKIRNPHGWLLKCLRHAYWEKAESWSFSSLLMAFGMSYESIEAMRSRISRD